MTVQMLGKWEHITFIKHLVTQHNTSTRNQHPYQSKCLVKNINWRCFNICMCMERKSIHSE